MTSEKKTPTGGDREGARNSFNPKLTKPFAFPKERLLWQALCEAIKRADCDPTPVNRMIAKIIAAHWKSEFQGDVQS